MTHTGQEKPTLFLEPESELELELEQELEPEVAAALTQTFQ